jgi:hypothetical protein
MTITWPQPRKEADMARRKVTMQTLALPLELPVLSIDGATALAALPPSQGAADTSCTVSWLPSLTKAQVHSWGELCGVLAQAGTAGVPSADDFPPEVRPSPSTLKAMVERDLLSRRQRAWHLTRH